MLDGGEMVNCFVSNAENAADCTFGETSTSLQAEILKETVDGQNRATLQATLIGGVSYLNPRIQFRTYYFFNTSFH